MNQRRSIGLVLVISTIIGLACSSSVPATTTRRTHVPLDPAGGVFVVANEQRKAIVASLERAGVRISPDFRSMTYALEVRLGSTRASKSCGSVHNVSYTLTSAGQRLMVIKGRGATGTCDPNIFDDMSRELAANMN